MGASHSIGPLNGPESETPIMESTKLFNFKTNTLIAEWSDAVQRVATALIDPVSGQFEQPVNARHEVHGARIGRMSTFMRLGRADDIVNGSRSVVVWLGHPEWEAYCNGDTKAADAMLAAYIGATSLELAYSVNDMAAHQESGEKYNAAFLADLQRCGIVPEQDRSGHAKKRGPVKASKRLHGMIDGLRKDLAIIRTHLPADKPKAKAATAVVETQRVRLYCVADCPNNDTIVTASARQLSQLQDPQTGWYCKAHDRAPQTQVIATT